MATTLLTAWKEEGLSPNERIERFFNLIDHAVESGVPLEQLYRRDHLIELLNFVLHQYHVPCRTCKKHENSNAQTNYH